MTKEEMLKDIQSVIAEYIADNGICTVNMVLDVKVVEGAVEPVTIL